MNGAADVVRARAALEHLEQVRLEALRAERDAVDAVRRGAARRAPGVTVSGFASTVISAARGQRGEQARERGGLGEGRRAAAEEDVSTLARERVALELELREQRVDVGAVLALRPTTVTKSQ